MDGNKKFKEGEEKMKDKITLKGHGYFELRRKDGTVVDRWECSNTIVSTGKERTAKLLNGISVVSFDTIAIGTGDTTPLIGDTALEVEVARAVASLAYEASNKATFTHTFIFYSAEAWAITEAGVFTSESGGGTMLDRFTFEAKNVEAGTDLYCKITITVA